MQNIFIIGINKNFVIEGSKRRTVYNIHNSYKYVVNL